ncbi:hypothetical protein HMPREF9154_0621 [Arachnia propionica F0230a]|nr:hypothetical protein HMPREF9154_0621 [Arachnia propionica F0230a]
MRSGKPFQPGAVLEAAHLSQWSLTFEVRERLTRFGTVNRGSVVAMEPDL